MTRIVVARIELDTWTLLFLAWLMALVATLGAIFIGEVMGQEPCTLCWYQRILMFPLSVMLVIALLSEDFAIWRYALPLAAGGVVIAGWHLLQYAGLIPKALEPCAATGPSCSGEGMAIFGGLPIPLLSLIAFIVIAGALELIRRRTAT